LYRQYTFGCNFKCNIMKRLFEFRHLVLASAVVLGTLASCKDKGQNAEETSTTETTMESESMSPGPEESTQMDTTTTSANGATGAASGAGSGSSGTGSGTGGSGSGTGGSGSGGSGSSGSGTGTAPSGQ
jgi:uncharacterized membrane protein YgcG